MAIICALAFGAFAGRISATDDNAKPVFGKTGLAVNCRAYVQVVVNSYRNREFDADVSMSSLERNCGQYGNTWIDNR